MKEKQFVKVQFYNPDVGYENLWASPLTNKRYRIESIPFFVYGVSLLDIVTASADEQGVLHFGRLLESSGNRTLRARSDDFAKKPSRRRKVIADLRLLGSDVEQLRSRLLGINVPPTVDLQTVKDSLTNDARVSWDYGNPEDPNRSGKQP
jgi:hypothetical protein